MSTTVEALPRRERSQQQRPAHDAIDVSVVMPCLNEEDSVGTCIDKAWEGIHKTGLRGEVVVSDNGSSDRSAEIALAHGARVVHQPERGYGNAYLAGFEAARGEYIVMGDADDTYDFSELDRFITPLTQGFDYVLGSRFKGEIRRGAMPWLNRYVGNPVLTWVLNGLFGLSASDAHSGMRAFSRAALDRMHLQTTGMEFASEIVINAAQARLRTTEVPITYDPRCGESKLHALRDGWRHLRFMLLHSPDHLFLLPALIVLMIGVAGMIWLVPGPQYVMGMMIDIHFMILSALFATLGAQILTLGLSAKAYAFTHRFVLSDQLIEQFYRYFSLERGLLVALILGSAGVGIDLYILVDWLRRSMGELNAVRPALFGSTLIVLGAQVCFGSCLLAILDIKEEARRLARSRAEAAKVASRSVQSAWGPEAESGAVRLGRLA